MVTILGGKYNLYTAVLNVGLKTLTISNIIGFDLETTSLQSVYSTTATKYLTLGKNVASCAYALVAGLPVWTYTFATIDAGIAGTDTFVVQIQIPDTLALYSLLSYSASKV